jgi:hypothetical protein
VIGANEYTKIKTETSPPKIGSQGEPIAEKTKFDWTIMSPGKEVNLNEMFMTQTSSADYEKLCRLDVLGLEDSPTGDQDEASLQGVPRTIKTKFREMVLDNLTMERKPPTSS